MTEREYINATNRAKISAALLILESVQANELPADNGLVLIRSRIGLRDIDHPLSKEIEIELEESE